MNERTKVDSTALLASALQFYANHNNWRSPSTGFAAQYDPEPSAIERDGGDRAKQALQQLAIIEANTADEVRR